MAGLLDAQLAVMTQAVQAAQLAQQVAHARFRRHARAIGVQPPAQHLRLPRRRQIAPRAQRKLAPSGPGSSAAKSSRATSSRIDAASAMWRACRATMPRQPGQRASSAGASNSRSAARV